MAERLQGPESSKTNVEKAKISAKLETSLRRARKLLLGWQTGCSGIGHEHDPFGVGPCVHGPPKISAREHVQRSPCFVGSQ